MKLVNVKSRKGQQNTFQNFDDFVSLDMELFSSRRWELNRPKQKADVFMLNPKKIMQHMHGIIP